mmetsp:Transcript_97249/g.280626  ORF Transcript_97249/g.280626 Transcript_97249/m.280626 type:complete len:218 (-) Transcript_97249:2752-3405(-)
MGWSATGVLRPLRSVVVSGARARPDFEPDLDLAPAEARGVGEVDAGDGGHLRVRLGVLGHGGDGEPLAAVDDVGVVHVGVRVRELRPARSGAPAQARPAFQLEVWDVDLQPHSVYRVRSDLLRRSLRHDVHRERAGLLRLWRCHGEGAQRSRLGHDPQPGGLDHVAWLLEQGRLGWQGLGELDAARQDAGVGDRPRWESCEVERRPRAHHRAFPRGC